MKEEGRLMVHNVNDGNIPQREYYPWEIMFPSSSSLVIQNLTQETMYEMYWETVVPLPFRNVTVQETVYAFST